jgi:hypothetical protein
MVLVSDLTHRARPGENEWVTAPGSDPAFDPNEVFCVNSCGRPATRSVTYAIVTGSPSAADVAARAPHVGPGDPAALDGPDGSVDLDVTEFAELLCDECPDPVVDTEPDLAGPQ